AAWQDPNQTTPPGATPESLSMADDQQTGATAGDSGPPGNASLSDSWLVGHPPKVAGYEVQGKLGEGGMGTVWKAWHLTLARLVPLKIVKAGGGPERFLTEARAMARLEPPLIVPVYEVGESGGRPFFAMEYLEGGSLDRHLAGNPLPPRAAAVLVQTLA